MSRIDAETRRIVAVRAQNVCEYCLLGEEDAFFRFQIEHIISRKHGGSSDLSNLALACIFCNRHKGSDIASTIPQTEKLTRFYNPRTDRWREHFLLNEVLIKPITSIGEATVRILQMNHEDQIAERLTLHRRKRYLNSNALTLISNQ